MRSQRFVVVALLAGITTLAALETRRADAIPAFARKYQLSCSTCHAPFPRLKPYGEEFAGRGFRMEDASKEPARATWDVGDPMLKLMREGNYPGLATHDVRLIKRAVEVATAEGIARDRFEFQMLFGVRRDLQDRLLRAGYRVRLYVPYGTEWYPYYMRRLAERPANVLFMLRAMTREGFGREGRG